MASPRPRRTSEARSPDADSIRADSNEADPAGPLVIDRDGLDTLIAMLAERGYRTTGPVVHEGAVSLGNLGSTSDLPEGWHDTQAPGSYRLEHSTDRALFGWAVGAESIKRHVFPSGSVLWRGRVNPDGVDLEEPGPQEVPVALVGARPCELAALRVLDRVMGDPRCPDPQFDRSRPSFVVVAECYSPSGTCFCTSMGTGPSAGGEFDLALMELLEGEDQRFVVRIGSELGAELIAEIPSRHADPDEMLAREAALEHAVEHMGRHLDTEGLPQLLARNLDHPRWDDVAERCLACGNCTMVCPTCFCANLHDTSDLDGTIRRERSWSSCFEISHSYIHGGAVRESKRSRYRQWMTHKLSTWWDQFGTSGCVGCGRCITWCPVGIDITEESAAIRAADGAMRPVPGGT